MIGYVTFGTNDLDRAVAFYDELPAVPGAKRVLEVYDKAIALGAQDEGGPGPRIDNFYAAYFRDLDGNKLNVFTLT